MHQRQLMDSFVSPRTPTSFFSQFLSQISSPLLPLIIPTSHSPLVPRSPCYRVGDLVALVTLLLKSPWSLTQCLGKGAFPAPGAFLHLLLSLDEGSAWAVTTE